MDLIQRFLLQHQLLQQREDFLTEGRTYVQRDLEDQIEEEYKIQGKVYQRTNINSNDMSASRPIVVQDVLELLQKGYTRYRKDDRGHGSIQDHYSLTGVEVKDLFNHPKLKQRKTIFPKTPLTIVDREAEGLEEQEAAVPVGVETREKEEPQKDVAVINKEELFS